MDNYVKVTSKGSYFVGGEKVTIAGSNPVAMEDVAIEKNQSVGSLRKIHN